MHIFIFDFQGTLSNQPDPAGFVRALKAKLPNSRVVLMTGTPKKTVEATCPGLLGALDAFWMKPCNPALELETSGWTIDHVSYYDDEDILRRAVARMFRSKLPSSSWTIEAAEALPLLLAE